MFNIDKMCGNDVDTLNAFMTKGHILYKPETELIKPNLRLITSTLQKYNIKILCFNDKHFGDEAHKLQESELTVNDGPFEIHAKSGTKGAEKIPETLLSQDVVYVPNDSSYGMSMDDFKHILFRAKQIIVEKQSYNVFYSNDNLGGNVNVDKIINILELEDFFSYGVYTDYCIKAAALGLLERKKNVWVIKDAIVPFNVNPDDGEKAIDEMSENGARFITTDAFVELLNSHFKSI